MKVFKTTVKAWMTEAVLPILFFGAVAGGLIVLRPYPPAVLVSIGVFGLILFRIAKDRRVLTR
jgi:hypothetical protein